MIYQSLIFVSCSRSVCAVYLGVHRVVGVAQRVDSARRRIFSPFIAHDLHFLDAKLPGPAHLSFASAMHGVKGSCAFLIGRSNIWASSLPSWRRSSGYSLGRLSTMEGWQARSAGSPARRSWLPAHTKFNLHCLSIRASRKTK